MACGVNTGNDNNTEEEFVAKKDEGLPCIRQCCSSCATEHFCFEKQQIIQCFCKFY